MKALIVDDEYMPAEFLEALIGQVCPEIREVQVMTDPREALRYLEYQAVDVLFLDVEMPELNGFDLIQQVPPHSLPPVIFTSAHQHYALQAFDIAAVHYLLKPVDPNQLKDAVKRVTDGYQLKSAQLFSALQQIQEEQKNQELISLPDGNRYHLVTPEEIVRVQGKGSYSTFYLQDGRDILVSKRIKYYADLLSSSLFIRPHQSHLVNKKQVVQFNKSEGVFLELRDGSIVPVSHGLRAKVKAQLGL